jgi:hypothetical protein
MNSHECPATDAKVCKDCGEKKPLSSYYQSKRPNGSIRYFACCKPCFGRRSAVSYLKRRDAKLKRCEQYREENDERIKAYLRQWYQENREHVINRSKAYQSLPERKRADKERLANQYRENREQIRARQNARNATPEGRAKQRQIFERHYEANVTYYVAKGAARRAKRMRATPPWVDEKETLSFYLEARRLTHVTGVKHVVDHIIPLTHSDVCGLHVPANLQVISELDNLRKANRFG